MTPCSCGHTTPDPVPLGIQPGIPGKMDDLILYDCRWCKSTRSIRWSEATQQQRHDAILARNTVWAADGWI